MLDAAVAVAKVARSTRTPKIIGAEMAVAYFCRYRRPRRASSGMALANEAPASIAECRHSTFMAFRREPRAGERGRCHVNIVTISV